MGLVASTCGYGFTDAGLLEWGVIFGAGTVQRTRSAKILVFVRLLIL